MRPSHLESVSDLLKNMRCDLFNIKKGLLNGRHGELASILYYHGTSRERLLDYFLLFFQISTTHDSLDGFSQQ